MDLAFVVNRLKAETELRFVGGAADLEAVISGQVVVVPSVYVIPLREVAVDASLIGTTEEEITQAFSVIQVVSNKKDVVGAAALGDLKSVRLAVREALVGWAPDAETGEPVLFTRGELLRLDPDARLLWTDEFSLKTTYRSDR